MDIFSLWSKVLGEVQKSDPQYYEVIMRGVFPRSFENGVFSIMITGSGPSWILGWFKAIYEKKLAEIISSLVGSPIRLEVVVQGQETPASVAPATPAPLPESFPQPAMPPVAPDPQAQAPVSQTPPAPFPEAPSTPAPDFLDKVSRGEFQHADLPNIQDKIREHGKEPMHPGNLFEPAGEREEVTEQFEDQVNINRQFTFDTFIHGPSNELAFKAAKSVAEAALSGSTDSRTNPLFIYGPSGLGKTHLLHAICNYIHDHAPKLNVRFVTSETFLNDLIKSIETSSMDKFRKRYRSVDYFLMDDVQLFSGKNSSQTEVFNTFNVLFDNKKHIILTSDRTPQDIEKLEDRIKTRFSSGLIAPIEPPDYEMCSVILLKKAEHDHIVLPEDVINYIAGHIHTNVRELNGAYNKLVSYAQFTQQKITLDMARTALKDVIPPDAKKELTMEFITDVVCEYYGVSKASVLSPGRPKKIVAARQMAMYFCRQELNESYPNIRDYFKRKDHTTVMYACNRVEKDLKSKPGIADDYQKIKKILASR